MTRRLTAAAFAVAATAAVVALPAGTAQAAPAGQAAPVGGVATTAALSCNWTVTGTDVRFRKYYWSTDRYGYLQPGNTITGVLGDTVSYGGNTFQYGYSGKFGRYGWVAVQYLRRGTCFQ
jgi:hypothetical protein